MMDAYGASSHRRLVSTGGREWMERDARLVSCDRDIVNKDMEMQARMMMMIKLLLTMMTMMMINLLLTMMMMMGGRADHPLCLPDTCLWVARGDVGRATRVALQRSPEKEKALCRTSTRVGGTGQCHAETRLLSCDRDQCELGQGVTRGDGARGCPRRRKRKRGKGKEGKKEKEHA